VPEDPSIHLLPNPVQINDQSRVSEKIERVGRKRRRIEESSEYLSVTSKSEIEWSSHYIQSSPQPVPHSDPQNSKQSVTKARKRQAVSSFLTF
jgi:hypothetical protein